MTERVTIRKDELERLLNVERLHDCLVACGVGDWQGYDDALVMLAEYGDDDE